MTPIRTMNVPGKPHLFHDVISPCEHLLQLYDDEDAFLDTLEPYVVGGLRGGESVIVIATPAHLEALDARLLTAGINLTRARVEDRYIPLDAAATLERFMINGWPDDMRFRSMVATLLARAGINLRRVRAFGEMVGVLWARGEHEATVRLEQLWHEIYRSANFSLLCAYPQNGFSRDTLDSVMRIRESHSLVVA